MFMKRPRVELLFLRIALPGISRHATSLLKSMYNLRMVKISCMIFKQLVESLIKYVFIAISFSRMFYAFIVSLVSIVYIDLLYEFLSRGQIKSYKENDEIKWYSPFCKIIYRIRSILWSRFIYGHVPRYRIRYDFETPRESGVSYARENKLGSVIERHASPYRKAPLGSRRSYGP